MKRTTQRIGLGMTLPALGFAVLLSMTVPVATHAQDERQDRPSREEMERQFRQRFQADVRRELNLTEQQSNAVQAIVDGMQTDRRTLAMREFRLQRLMRSDSVVLTQAQASSALDELVAIKQEEARLMSMETVRLRRVLPDAKVIEFYQLREEMGRRIQNVRRGGGERGGGMMYSPGASDHPFVTPGLPSPG